LVIDNFLIINVSIKCRHKLVVAVGYRTWSNLSGINKDITMNWLV